VDRGDDLGARVGDGRGDRGEPRAVLVADPRVPVAADLAQPFEQAAGVRERARRELLQRLGEVALAEACYLAKEQ
jgi:hypothetical protein